MLIGPLHGFHKFDQISLRILDPAVLQTDGLDQPRLLGELDTAASQLFCGGFDVVYLKTDVQRLGSFHRIRRAPRTVSVSPSKQFDPTGRSRQIHDLERGVFKSEPPLKDKIKMLLIPFDGSVKIRDLDGYVVKMIR